MAIINVNKKDSKLGLKKRGRDFSAQIGSLVNSNLEPKSSSNEKGKQRVWCQVLQNNCGWGELKKEVLGMTITIKK